MELWEHQKKAVPELVKSHHLLAFYPGTGKTLTALTAMGKVGGRHLVIAPAAILTQWEKQAEAAGFPTYVIRSGKDHHIPDEAEVVVTSYHLAIRKLVWIALMKHEWDSLTLDESHMVKSVTAKMSWAIWGRRANQRSIYKQARRVWCLTGTPLLKDPTDLYMMLSRLWPRDLDDLNLKNKAAFLTHFCTYVNTPYGMKVTGAMRKKELRQLLANKMTHCGADTTRPPLVIDTQFIDGKSIDTSDLDPDLLDALATALGNDDADALGRLEPEMATLRRYIGEAKVLPVVQRVLTELSSGYDKLALFYQHVDVGRQIEHQLRGHGVYVSRIGGDVAKEDRDKRLAQFRDDPRVTVFLGQMQATGIGLDGLQHATNRVMLLEPAWTPGPNEQAIARVARGGSKFGSCYASYVVLNKSLDEQIMRVVTRRQNEVKEIIG